MTLDEIRAELRRAREHALAGEAATAAAEIDRVLAELTPPRLVTAADAATLLGIQSEFIVQLWCGDGSLRCERVDGCWLVPLTEIERFADSDQVEMIRNSDRYHDVTRRTGVGRTRPGMARRSLGSRPGQLPWQK